MQRQELNLIGTVDLSSFAKWLTVLLLLTRADGNRKLKS